MSWASPFQSIKQRCQFAGGEPFPNPVGMQLEPALRGRSFAFRVVSAEQVRHKGCNAAIVPFERQIRRNLDILPLPPIKCKPF
jgi:hypothetical protein